jgi:hypothetical protein
LHDNKLEAIKLITELLSKFIDLFKKTTQSWGGTLILASIGLFLAAEPGFWEFWYSVFSEDLKGSHVSPEPNIFLRAVAFIILFIGIPLLITTGLFSNSFMKFTNLKLPYLQLS